jgi:uncharacterized protein YciW
MTVLLGCGPAFVPMGTTRAEVTAGITALSALAPAPEPELPELPVKPAKPSAAETEQRARRKNGELQALIAQARVLLRKPEYSGYGGKKKVADLLGIHPTYLSTYL